MFSVTGSKSNQIILTWIKSYSSPMEFIEAEWFEPILHREMPVERCLLGEYRKCLLLLLGNNDKRYIT